MAPLTWRNVEAPDLRGVSDMMQRGNAGITGAFKGAAGIGRGIFADQTEAGSRTAMDAALGFANSADWTQALADGQATGNIDPRFLNTETMQFLAGRRNELLREEQLAQNMEIQRQQEARAAEAHALRLAGGGSGGDGRSVGGSGGGGRRSGGGSGGSNEKLTNEQQFALQKAKNDYDAAVARDGANSAEAIRLKGVWDALSTEFVAYSAQKDIGAATVAGIEADKADTAALAGTEAGIIGGVATDADISAFAHGTVGAESAAAAAPVATGPSVEATATTVPVDAAPVAVPTPPPATEAGLAAIDGGASVAAATGGPGRADEAGASTSDTVVPPAPVLPPDAGLPMPAMMEPAPVATSAPEPAPAPAEAAPEPVPYNDTRPITEIMASNEDLFRQANGGDPNERINNARSEIRGLEVPSGETREGVVVDYVMNALGMKGGRYSKAEVTDFIRELTRVPAQDGSGGFTTISFDDAAAAAVSAGSYSGSGGLVGGNLGYWGGLWNNTLGDNRNYWDGDVAQDTARMFGTVGGVEGLGVRRDQIDTVQGEYQRWVDTYNTSAEFIRANMRSTDPVIQAQLQMHSRALVEAEARIRGTDYSTILSGRGLDTRLTGVASAGSPAPEEEGWLGWAGRNALAAGEAIAGSDLFASRDMSGINFSDAVNGIGAFTAGSPGGVGGDPRSFGNNPLAAIRDTVFPPSIFGSRGTPAPTRLEDLLPRSEPREATFRGPATTDAAVADLSPARRVETVWSDPLNVMSAMANGDASQTALMEDARNNPALAQQIIELSLALPGDVELPRWLEDRRQMMLWNGTLTRPNPAGAFGSTDYFRNMPANPGGTYVTTPPPPNWGRENLLRLMRS